MENEKFTVEWSEKQQCFHIDTMQGILQKNTEMYLNHINNEFALIGIFNSHKIAHEFIVELKKARNIYVLDEDL